MWDEERREFSEWWRSIYDWLVGSRLIVMGKAGAAIKKAGSSLLRWAALSLGGMIVGGWFVVTCVKADGSVRWIDQAFNGVTNAGLNHILNVEFVSTTQITAWYIGLVDNASFSAFAAADTLASHAGWTESTDYTGNRKAWSLSATSSQSLSNASTADFVMNAAKTLKGLFLASASSGSTGTLFSTAAFSGGNQTVASGDTLQSTYVLSAASS